MDKTRMLLTTLGVLTLTIAFATSAQAVSFRTHVATTGNDANTATNCSRPNPCRNFAAAYSVTSPNGEVVALDSGGFGGVTITNPVTIMAIPGQAAFITVTAGNSGVTVNAGANDTVVLRNLQFQGSESANSIGVRFNSGKALNVENCTFTGLDKGIYDVAAPSLMYVSDSTLANVHDGIFLEPTDTDNTHRAQAFIEHCRFSNYFQGVVVAGRYTSLTIRDSHLAGRSKNNLVTYGGIIAAPTSVGTTHIMVENCLLSNNYLAIGTKTDGVAFISLSQNVIYGNQLGVFTCCLSKMITFQNNRFENNNDDGFFNLSTDLK